MVGQTDFDIIVYGLADAAGLVMINDAGHGERRDMAGRREGGRRAKRKMLGRKEIYHDWLEQCVYKREIISDHNSQGSFPPPRTLASPAMRLEAPVPPLLLRFIPTQILRHRRRRTSPVWDSVQVMRPFSSTVVGASACHFRRAVGGTQCVCRISTNERA